ncbi:MAG: hypothetical protein II933_05210 [Candidatus Methanomethylophilaceae archaeon]|nr:hypothetical protein [Thermoplasmata archaeon]MBQ3685757.1 hypothetical protein [Candidatus Methanomethylophilaceae archaeon]
MQPTIQCEAILSCPGVIRMEGLDNEALMDAMNTELAVDRISGGMKLENIGVVQCCRKQFVGVMFCRGEFRRPDACSMYIINDKGIVIGREVTKVEKEAMKDDPNVAWLSSTMAMFLDKVDSNDARFVISAMPFKPEGMPRGMEAVIYYPSVVTAKKLNEIYGVDDENSTVSTILIGINGISTESDMIASPVGVAIGTGAIGSRIN